MGSEVQILPGPPTSDQAAVISDRVLSPDHWPLITDHRGGVAQLGEHLLCKQGVVGSSPITSILAAKRTKSPGGRLERASGLYRREAKAIGIDGSVWTAMPLVSPVEMR